MVACSKCGRPLVPVYAGDGHDFLIGGWCSRCKRTYPLMSADLECGRDGTE